MSKLMDAIQSLRPNAKCVTTGETDVEWLDDEQVKPTQSEIDAEIIRLQAKFNSQAYARNRKDEYPDLAEQLDYIYHNGITKWKSDMIQPVKDKYPKG